jgi:hypothetical protein
MSNKKKKEKESNKIEILQQNVAKVQTKLKERLKSRNLDSKTAP